MTCKILVVGGAGYIGSHMVLAARDAGYEVVVFDNLSRGFCDAVGSAELIVGDLRSLSDLEDCFCAHEIDLVMHFAAFAYVRESVSEPELYYRNNVVGALNLLEAMRRHQVSKFVFSSTCAIYGKPEYLPIDEVHPKKPINPYGRTKLMIEQALEDYAHGYGMNSVSLRYFNAAGCDLKGRACERHEPETHLIPLTLSEALRIRNGGDPLATQLRVFGIDFATRDGSCIRDYIHVTDLCRAHLLAAQGLLDSQLTGAKAYNLSIGVGFSVFEVINICRQVTGHPIQYRQEARRPGDPAELVGDASLVRLELGWRPNFRELRSIVKSAWDLMTCEDKS